MNDIEALGFKQIDGCRIEGETCPVSCKLFCVEARISDDRERIIITGSGHIGSDNGRLSEFGVYDPRIIDDCVCHSVYDRRERVVQKADIQLR